MMTTFADLAAPDPTSVGVWLGVYAALIVAVYYTLAVLHRIRGGATDIKPQPFVVKEHEAAATKPEHEKLEKKVDANDAWARSARKGTYERLDNHGARISALEQSAERTADNVAKLETKIDGNTTLTAETRGEVKQINQSVQNLTSSLTNFLRDQAKK